MEDDFITSYMYYSGSGEVPAIFNRWAAIAGIGAYLGRNYYLEHGHFNIYPNIYSLLIGTAGTRKSTAIKLMKSLLQEAGYKTIAASKTTKEKFMLDLAGESDDQTKGISSAEELLDQNLWGSDSASSKPDAEIFIMADEFNDFFGNGNIEFISLLGNLWDFTGVFENRIKNGKSVSINNPTISILGGNTPTGFALAFPTEALGQGFFSRLLLIYGEPNGKRITFPEAPEKEAKVRLVENLKRIKQSARGNASLSSEAKSILDRIYQTDRGVADVRFDAYSTRRFTHLLKLCLIVSAAQERNTITGFDVIYANTILSHAEHLMPKALGEFGKAKHSDVSHKIISLAQSTYQVLTFKDIWKHVSSDLEKMADLATLIQNLVASEKLQAVPGGAGFLPRRALLDTDIKSDLVDYSLLTPEELRISK